MEKYMDDTAPACLDFESRIMIREALETHFGHINLMKDVLGIVAMRYRDLLLKEYTEVFKHAEKEIAAEKEMEEVDGGGGIDEKTTATPAKKGTTPAKKRKRPVVGAARGATLKATGGDRITRSDKARSKYAAERAEYAIRGKYATE